MSATPQTTLWTTFVFFHAAAVVLDATEKWQLPALALVLTALAAWLLFAPPRVRAWLDVAWFAASTVPLLAVAPELANHKNLTLYVNLVVLGGWAASSLRARRWRPPDDALFAALAPVLRASVVVVYFFAGFHKLNRDFLLEPQVSCAGWFADKLGDLYAGTPLALPGALVIALAVLTLAVELGLAAGLALSRGRARLVVLCVAWALHGVLALAVFFDFSALMFALLWAFVPATWLRGDPDCGRRVRLYLAGVLLAGLAGGLVIGVAPGAGLSLAFALQGIALDVALLVVVVPLVAVVWRGAALQRCETRDASAILGRSACHLLALAPLVLALFSASNYLGLRTAGTFSMFSNLRTEGGVSNHLLIPAEHPLVLSDMQRDLVWIETLDARLEPGQRASFEGFLVPRVELDKHLVRWRAQGLSPLRATLRDEAGRRHEVFDLTSLPTLATARHPWAMWWLDLRPVQADTHAPNACRW